MTTELLAPTLTFILGLALIVWAYLADTREEPEPKRIRFDEDR